MPPTLSAPFPTRPTHPAHARARIVPDFDTVAPAWLFVALAFATGALTSFVIDVVGLLPIGELVLAASLVYLGLWIMIHHRRPGWLLGSPLLWTFIACQGVAFLGYVIADLYRGSTSHDILRGWARMVFLAMDVVGVAFLFGGSARKQQAREAFVGFEWGYVVGMVWNALFGVVLFGDYWKFGFALPVTILVMLLAPRLGFWATQAACLALGVLHMSLAFRSVGAMCLLLPFAMILQRTPSKQRAVVLPLCLVLGLAAVGYLYAGRTVTESTAAGGTRSDVERGAMVEAAWNGFRNSPFIGNGSWFSKSDVMIDFYAIRFAKSIEKGIGSFPEGEEENVIMVIHSQILVGLAEGGILGGCFFLAFGAGLVWALGYCMLRQPWHRLSAIYLFTLLQSLWALGMSPFSGAHRVIIAVSTGLILCLWAERTETRRAAATPTFLP